MGDSLQRKILINKIGGIKHLGTVLCAAVFIEFLQSFPIPINEIHFN